jgi:hypothetical protein
LSNKRKVAVKAAATDRVVLAYIHPGEVSAYFCQSLTNLLMWDQATSKRIVGCLNEWSSANISQARNSLTQRFLTEYDADWMLWIDADMAFDHEALDQLLKSASVDDMPIMGGLCFGATYGRLFPTIYYFAEGTDGKPTTFRVEDYPRNQIVSCAATGSAFILIHRRVFEAIRDKGFNQTFPWYQETELSGQPAGEDLTFCIRAAICGFETHVDTRVKIGHHKSHVLDEDLFNEQHPKEGDDGATGSDAG